MKIKRPRKNSIDNQKQLAKAIAHVYGERCAYCNEDFGFMDRPELDHVNPISNGGSDEIDNLVLSCKTCNRSKGGKTIRDWFVPGMFRDFGWFWYTNQTERVKMLQDAYAKFMKLQRTEVEKPLEHAPQKKATVNYNDKWLDGHPHTLIRGVDFDGEIKNCISSVQSWCTRFGLPNAKPGYEGKLIACTVSTKDARDFDGDGTIDEIFLHCKAIDLCSEEGIKILEARLTRTSNVDKKAELRKLILSAQTVMGIA